jgi:predicted DNA repair protein MutK
VKSVATGLLLLLDDITSILDDVAVLTKVAAKKTAGVLGDDLALNAEQVTGVDPSRELPVVWAVAKGSLVNKAILVPVALLLSAAVPWMITPLLILGGLYLCFEGCEKLAHKFFHSSAEDQEHHKQLHEALQKTEADVLTVEKGKIRGAIRTDFVLSAEIIVIALETVAASDFTTRVAVLVAIALLMTVGVYGLVAAIVKLDDFGAKLIRSGDSSGPMNAQQRMGTWILAGSPYLMKTLSIVGTIAMFLVGGGILAHGFHQIQETIKAVVDPLAQGDAPLRFLGTIAKSTLEGLVGLVGGLVVLVVVTAGKNIYKKFVPAIN